MPLEQVAVFHLILALITSSRQTNQHFSVSGFWPELRQLLRTANRLSVHPFTHMWLLAILYQVTADSPSIISDTSSQCSLVPVEAGIWKEMQDITADFLVTVAKQSRSTSRIRLVSPETVGLASAAPHSGVVGQFAIHMG